MNEKDKLNPMKTPGPEVLIFFSNLIQLSMFIMLIHFKVPTVVGIGILKFISMINTITGRLKARNLFICAILDFMSSCIYMYFVTTTMSCLYA